MREDVDFVCPECQRWAENSYDPFWWKSRGLTLHLGEYLRGKHGGCFEVGAYDRIVAVPECELARVEKSKRSGLIRRTCDHFKVVSY